MGTDAHGPVWARIGPASGIVFVVLLAAAMTMGPFTGDPGVRPGDPAEEITVAMAALTADVGIAPFVLLGVAMVFLVLFLADVHDRVLVGAGSTGRWVATTFLVGGVLTIVALLVQIFIWVSWSVAGDAGDDAQVAKVLFTLGWNGLVVIVPGLVAMTGAAAVASLRFGVLPAWVGVVALLAALVAVVAYWIPVWLLWVLAAAVVLLVDPRRAGRAGRRPAAGAG